MYLSIGSKIKDGKGEEYILDEIIGQGGFGYVFKAHRETDGKVFAVKTLLPFFNDKTGFVSFQNEINVAQEIQGDNIISYEFANSGDFYPNMPPYIIMEYADGGTLKELLENKEFIPEIELKSIFKQLACGMKAINSRLVHRDIKPDNILICGNSLKISDFGLSKIASENTRTLTFKGFGTPLYMAPEAWDYSKNTMQMDIYSMGVVFYQLATKQYPYDPIPNQIDEVKNAHLLLPVCRIEDINSDISPTIVSIIYRMLEKDSRKRFSEWDEILLALDEDTDTEIIHNKELETIVASAVTSKNQRNLKRQEQESQEKKREREIESFCKLVRAQFYETIYAAIEKYVNGINKSYAGNDKLSLTKNNTRNSKDREYFSCSVEESLASRVTISFEALLKENHFREVSQNDPFSRRPSIRSENYVPQYEGRDILGWGEIQSSYGKGFNLLLIDSGEIYGDWIIMNNKNNFSLLNGRERIEPFAFKLDELEQEINRIHVTHSYSSDFEDYTDELFLKMINDLLFG